ncbi:MAG: transcriptional repressor NrdR [Chlamydiales bacterium]|nr:transcriptional repressor NrdR [Chlamydiales bacterium]
MQCPYCGCEELKVTDSRNAIDANAIRRRRECLGCSRRFTTFEMLELTMQVKKRDGCYEDFQEQKLISGLEAACRHTSVSHEQVRTIASKVTSELMDKQTREISSKEIGEIVMKYLKSMDTIAYIRFACVYRRFKDIGELMEAIHSVTPEGEKHGIEEVRNCRI